MSDSFFDQVVLADKTDTVYYGRNTIPITKSIFPQGHRILYRVIRRFKFLAIHESYSNSYQSIDLNMLILEQILRELNDQFPGDYIVECVEHLATEWWDYFKHHAEPEIVFVLVFKSAWERDWWVLRWL